MNDCLKMKSDETCNAVRVNEWLENRFFIVCSFAL